ncbi:MAG: enoyl-CoA hydratase/isomerase family protein [Chloroflexi bacterium]|nr:enoyl-CoA hydratase/isomerase family protein [Chloroflexota bacterium]
MSDENPILLEHDGPVAIVTLNRPHVLNALSRKLFTELYDTMDRLDEDDDTAVIVVTGAGDRAFSAGADIKEMARLAAEDVPPPSSNFSENSWRFATGAKPRIGALNGLCYGGGGVLSTSFDIRVGCERTRFRFLAVTYGRINNTWLLPTIVGLPAAREYLFTGRIVEPDEAYRAGLLNHLVQPDQVLPKAMEIAHDIAKNDQRMVQGAKRLIDGNIGRGWREQFEEEIAEQKTKLAPTPVLEGFKEFIDRKGTG